MASSSGYLRTAFWDIETAPPIACVWGLYDQNIPYHHIIQDWFIVCAAWEIDGEVSSVSVLDDVHRFIKDHTDDYHVVKALHNMIESVDVIIAHNGDKFDWRKFMARVVYHGLPPVRPPIFVDTLKMARKFGFLSNKLDDLGNHLDLGRKEQLEKGLWVKAAQGDVEAIRTMIEYNKADIPPLKNLYARLKPYTKTPNENLHAGEPVCPSCGGIHYQRRGYAAAAGGLYPRFQCIDCGKWFQGVHRAKGVQFK